MKSSRQQTPATELPKNVFMYWHDGFDEAPEVVHTCLRRVRALNPEWTFHLLDGTTVLDYIPDNPVNPERWNALDHTKKANLYRVWLLERYGGLWIDATAFCMIPFDAWLPQRMQAGLLFFRDPGPDRILSNWFIASMPENEALNRFISAYEEYWNSHEFRSIGHPKQPTIRLVARVLGRSRVLSRLWLTPLFTRWLGISPYFAFHYIFEQLVRKDSEVRRSWAKMPHICANRPHLLLRHGLDSPVSPEIERELSSPTIPIFKLSWKSVPQEVSPGTVMQRLIEVSNRTTQESGSSPMRPPESDLRCRRQ